MNNSEKIQRIVIVSAIEDDWGGSESLWSECVPHLISAGIEVTVLKKHIGRDHSKFLWLSNLGVTLFDLVCTRPGTAEKDINPNNPLENFESNFSIYLSLIKPDLVLINQGINFDGLIYGYLANQMKINYCIISHKVAEFFWPLAANRETNKILWQNSLNNFFVSHHNLKNTAYQVGMDIPRAKIVKYPIKTYPAPLTYPSIEDNFRLACMGRFKIIDKRQDLILTILSQKEWKERNVQVDFYGSGDDEQALKELAVYLGLKNVNFIGYSNEQDIWKNYHGLLLPSISEGLPLVVQEAMAAGRICIAGNAGGTGELIVDGKNGFMGDANMKDFSATMERAWNKRDKWEAMGKQAFIDFNAFYPKDPALDFTHILKNLCNG